MKQAREKWKERKKEKNKKKENTLLKQQQNIYRHKTNTGNK